MNKIEQIRKTCMAWHSGQWSALYQFASSGVFVPENILRYLKELEECRHPEFDLYPHDITKRDDDRLAAAQRWFEKQYTGEIKWGDHPVYGYRIPYLVSDDPQVTALLIAI